MYITTFRMPIVWTDSLDKSISTDVVYLDFAKAFDAVFTSLEYMESAAKCYGGSQITTEGRKLSCTANGNSSWENVISGVPQGSILRTILFLLYVNDIPSIVSSTAEMFADDTKLYCPIRTIYNQLWS